EIPHAAVRVAGEHVRLAEGDVVLDERPGVGGGGPGLGEHAVEPAVVPGGAGPAEYRVGRDDIEQVPGDLHILGFPPAVVDPRGGDDVPGLGARVTRRVRVRVPPGVHQRARVVAGRGQGAAEPV